MEREFFAEKGQHIGKACMKRLKEMKEKHDIIGDIRGLGAMIAIELVKDRETKESAKDETNKIIAECYKNGLVILSAGVRGNVIRFLMPLVVTDKQLEIGLDILEKAIEMVNSELLALT